MYKYQIKKLNAILKDKKNIKAKLQSLSYIHFVQKFSSQKSESYFEKKGQFKILYHKGQNEMEFL